MNKPNNYNTIILTALLIISIVAVLFLEQKAKELEKQFNSIYIRYREAQKTISYNDSICQLNMIHINSLHNLLNYKPLRHLKPKADSINKLYNYSNN